MSRAAGNKAGKRQAASKNKGSNDEDNEEDLILIAVMGATGSGKSTFVNLVSGSHLPVSDSLLSCTTDVLQSETFDLFGRRVKLIDTPGFDDSKMSDTQILRKIALFLSSTYQVGRKLSGVLYMHRISDVRVGGKAVSNLRMFKKLCGEAAYANVTVVTTRWGEEPDKARAEARESELEASEDLGFSEMLRLGARMVRHEVKDSKERAMAIIGRFIETKQEVLSIQRELVDEKKDITQTGAGAELVDKTVSDYQRQIAELEQQMQIALNLKDAEMKEEIAEAKREFQHKLDEVHDQKKRFEEEYKKMEEQMRAVIEDLEEEKAHHERLDDEILKVKAQLSPGEEKEKPSPRVGGKKGRKGKKRWPRRYLDRILTVVNLKNLEDGVLAANDLKASS